MASQTKSQIATIHKTKLKHKTIALAIHNRATKQHRQKIAWAILHHPDLTLREAQLTLEKQIQRRGNIPAYRAWKRILTQTPSTIAKELLKNSERAQKRNSCHPFGNALTIYETHYPTTRPSGG